MYEMDGGRDAEMEREMVSVLGVEMGTTMEMELARWRDGSGDGMGDGDG